MNKQWLLLIHILFPALLFAQRNPKDSIQLKKAYANEFFVGLYKENADLAYTTFPSGEIGAPTKYVINGRLTTTYMLLGSYKSPVAFSVIPDFTVRVRNEFSAAVRTPSYRLGGVFYARLNQNPAHYKYATLAFTHHSNGQDQEARNADGSINTINGNFNTNYLTFSYRFGRLLKSATSDTKYHTVNHGIGFQSHKPFRYEPVLDDGFGFTRLLYNFSLRRYDDQEWKSLQQQNRIKEKETWRLNAEISYAINDIPGKNIVNLQKRLNAEINFNYSFPFMQNVFLMAAAGYYGEDNYNIYFQDKYAYMRFGLSSGFLRNRARN